MEPGVAEDGGLNAAMAPAGSPDRVTLMVESKPLETVVVIVVVLADLAPGVIETDVGATEIAKDAGALTVRVMVAVWVDPPPVPVTVTL